MKKSSLITILIIFILPLALYYFFNVSEENNASIANANPGMPKVLQFSSTMCYDCKRIEKEMVVLRQEFQGKISFQKYNVSSQSPAVQQLVQRYSINVVPTLIFIDKNGRMVRKTEGYQSQSQLRTYLNELIKR